MAKQKGVKATPHFYNLFQVGLEPKDLIAMGKNPPMVYYYHRKWIKEVKPAFEADLKARINTPVSAN